VKRFLSILPFFLLLVSMHAQQQMVVFDKQSFHIADGASLQAEIVFLNENSTVSTKDGIVVLDSAAFYSDSNIGVPGKIMLPTANENKSSIPAIAGNNKKKNAKASHKNKALSTLSATNTHQEIRCNKKIIQHPAHSPFPFLPLPTNNTDAKFLIALPTVTGTQSPRVHTIAYGAAWSLPLAHWVENSYLKNQAYSYWFPNQFLFGAFPFSRPPPFLA